MAFYTWKKFENPSTGWLASKTTGWTADSFSGGLEVDFSSVGPAGTKAIRVQISQSGTVGSIYHRKSGDTNISNTPNTSSEFSHRIMGSADGVAQTVIWLSSDYKAQFAVTNTGTDLYIAYPMDHMGCPEPFRINNGFYLKEYADGWEYSPVGKKIDQAKLDAGFKIVDIIPQSIRDKEPGEKDWVPTKSALELKVEELEQRLNALEVK